MGYRIFLALGKLRHCNLSVIGVWEKQRIISKTMLSTLDKADEGGWFVLVRDLSSNGSMRLNSYLDFGRWTVNSVPWPTVLSTSIEPFPRSIAWRTSDKPNPVPPTSRLLALSTR